MLFDDKQLTNVKYLTYQIVKYSVFSLYLIYCDIFRNIYIGTFYIGRTVTNSFPLCQLIYFPPFFPQKRNIVTLPTYQ